MPILDQARRLARIRWKPDVHRDAMLLIGVMVGVAHAFGGFAAPVDAVSYWEAGSSTNLYPETWAEAGGAGYIFYPPPLAQVSTLLQPLGWPIFIVLLMSATFGAFWYCAREWSLPLVAIGIPYFLGVGPELAGTFLGYALLGNIQWLLAALSIVALRHPAIWAVHLVSKITAAIGWWWFVLRGEWRAAAVGALASVIVIGVSFALAPAMWFDFIGMASRNAGMADPPMPLFAVPFGVRIATAIPVLIWGARTDRPWTVPAVVGWSLPAIYGYGFLPFFVAAARLYLDPGLARTPMGPHTDAARPGPRQPGTSTADGSTASPSASWSRRG